MKVRLLIALTLLICSSAWAAPPQEHQYIVKLKHLFQQPNASAAPRAWFKLHRIYKYALRDGKWVQVKYQLRIIYVEAEKIVLHANISGGK